ncbi:MAG: hypothetical protein OXL34_02700 [Gemmatimonadota bacterium]|nr:hypothetical protein [Gemmatimonadota bacterium]
MGRFRNVILALGSLCATFFAHACDKGTEPPPDPPAPVDREPLVRLYEATGGPGWINDDGWNTDAPLDEWYGVETDASGRVVGLDLSGTWDEENLRWNRHGLEGPIPPELGDLSYLRSLVLAGNELQGEIPAELGNLSDLTRLDLGHNTLWGGIPRQLGDLYQLTELNLRNNRLSEWIPWEIGRLGELASLDLSWNGLSRTIPEALGHLSNLKELSLSHNLLLGGIPRDIGRLTELRTVSISHNPGMSGLIPPEIGNLSNLTTLLLHQNDLQGRIPSSLGNLTSLTTLSLYENNLQGEIPPELGNLASLELLYLDGNSLTGSIPPQLGHLTSVEVVALDDNQLSGAIPGALGGLSSTWYLALDHNGLAGPIPPGLADLPRIEQLQLGFNDLTGPIPAEFGNLATLRELGLMNNPSLAGPLPLELASLPRLEVLLAGNTGLCVPADSSLQAWLERVHKRRIAPCDREDPPPAYLIQAVQSWEYPVPLVAGKEALLRVFVTAAHPTTATIPPVRARFYRDGVETHVEEIPGKPEPIPTEVVENLLTSTANAKIPGHVVQPGLEMVIEIDPEGTLDPELGVATRIPETGRLPVDVRAVPLLDLTMVPMVWADDPDFSVRTLVREMAEDPQTHPLLSLTRTLLPILEMDITSHITVTSASNHSSVLLRETTAIRAMEGGTGHYMGMMAPPVSGPSGLAHLPGRSSFSQPYSTLIPHLLGHNFFLGDAPCGRVVRLDRSYPDPLGAIGTWAYDPRGSGRLIPPTRLDIMSYCDPVWISEYHFTNALRFRVSEADSVGLPTVGPSTRALLLWGGVDAEGSPFLEPTFVVDAPPALPRSPGRFRLAGRTGDGAELFSFSFEMPVVADGDGDSGFAFVLPVGAGWEARLAGITLSGPGGSATLDTEDVLPMAVLRDPRNGQIHAILRDLPGTVLTAADATAALSPEPGLEVLFSRGIPASDAWQR